jgi:hypothetical protein
MVISQSTQSGNGHFLAYIPSTRVKPARAAARVGVHAYPISLYLPSRTNYCSILYAPAEKADTLPLFLLYPYVYSVVHMNITHV